MNNFTSTFLPRHLSRPPPQRLELQIPGFVLRRRVQIFLKEEEGPQGDKGIVVSATGLDVDENVPYSFVRVRELMTLQTLYRTAQY